MEQRPLSHPFNDSEIIEIFEFARTAMQDADVFDETLAQMDLSNEYGCELRSKLESFMAGDYQDLPHAQNCHRRLYGFSECDCFKSENDQLSDQELFDMASCYHCGRTSLHECDCGEIICDDCWDRHQDECLVNGSGEDNHASCIYNHDHQAEPHKCVYHN